MNEETTTPANATRAAASPQGSPMTGDTLDSTRKSLFDTTGPRKPPMTSRLPQTERHPPAELPASTPKESREGRDSMQAQMDNLCEQVKLQGQQMAMLMSLMAQQQHEKIAAAANDQGSADTGRATAGDAKVTGIKHSDKSEQAANAGGTTYLQAAQSSTASSVHRPSSVMLTTHQFRKTDLQMYDDCQGLKPMPINPSVTLSAVSRIKPGIVKAVGSITQPGLEADIAISTFLSEVKAVLSTPADHTLAALLTEALTTGSTAADSATQNLLRLAVKCGSTSAINLQAEQVRKTGRYDRKMAVLSDVTKDKAWPDFDPQTPQGKHLWAAILDLLLAYWQKSKSGSADQMALEIQYSKLACTKPTGVSAHLTAEAELYTKLLSSHVIYSDQQRIRAILASCSKQITQDYYAFKKRKQQDGEWDHRKDTDVNWFSQDLEAVADAMQPAQQQADNKQDKTEGDVKPKAQDKKCWDHQNLQKGCSKGDACKLDHDGEVAAKMLRHATAEGVCKAHLMGTCSRGDQCRFMHSDQPAIAWKAKDQDQDELAVHPAALEQKAKLTAGT
jgi:hypothetical protein